MNNPRAFWEQVLARVRDGDPCALLCVVESTGSSPGRAGFKMFVSSSGTMCGSIGGGSMEHKLVELARSLVDQAERFPFFKRQIHREGEERDRSGMICSGEQTVAFYLLTADHLGLIERILNTSDGDAELLFGSTGLHLLDQGSPRTQADEVWFRERPASQPRIAIVGGGHVGLALSRLMRQLGFHVLQFDHRDELSTMEENEWAHEKHVVDFAHIEEHIPGDPGIFIALVSHGYRTDEIALRRLIRRRWRYLGMLGSTAKVEAMWAKLRADGFTDEELVRVHAPIGMPINSRTPGEIAVSIAAQIIAVKNLSR